MSLSGQALRKIGLDRNPLRRTSDRVEAWVTVFLIIALVLVMPYGAWRAGRASFAAGVRTERAEQGQRYRTEAVLLPNPDGAAASDSGPEAPGQDSDSAVPGRAASAYTRVRAYARWTAVDGTEHHGFISAPAPAQPGTRVPVWTNTAGDLTSPPQRRFQTMIDAVAVAVMTAAAAVGLLAAVRALLHRILEARRLAQWQEAWWQYEPRWTGRRW